MKVAIIGAGRMGRRHIEVAQSLGLDIVGVCDVQPGALTSIEKEHGVPSPRHFSNPREMLEHTRPTCVVVATTAPAHCEFTCLAAEAGAEVILCEKPMGVSLGECDRMIQVCKRKGSRLAVNHQMRFMEQYTGPKRVTRSPEFGGLRSVTVIAGNFGLAMNGSHYFEMFRYITDTSPVEVTAWFSADRVPNPRGEQFEDRAGCVRLVTASGVRFYLDASSDQGHGFQVIYAGRNGQLTVDEAAGTMYLSVRDEAHREQPTTRYLMPHTIKTTKIQPADAVGPTRAVLAALLNGQDYPTGEDGRTAVQILAAAHLSNELGNRPVRMDDRRLDPERMFPWA